MKTFDDGEAVLGEAGEEVAVECCGAFMAVPRAPVVQDRVGAIRRQRREKARDVAPMLGRDMIEPELFDPIVFRCVERKAGLLVGPIVKWGKGAGYSIQHRQISRQQDCAQRFNVRMRPSFQFWTKCANALTTVW